MRPGKADSAAGHEQICTSGDLLRVPLRFRIWSPPMDKPQHHKPNGWKAGLAGRLVKLNLGPRSATSPPRRLQGDELEQAKHRLMERYRPTPPRQ